MILAEICEILWERATRTDRSVRDFFLLRCWNYNRPAASWTRSDLSPAHPEQNKKGNEHREGFKPGERGTYKTTGGLPRRVTLNQDLFHFVTEKINLV